MSRYVLAFALVLALTGCGSECPPGTVKVRSLRARYDGRVYEAHDCIPDFRREWAEERERWLREQKRRDEETWRRLREGLRR